MRASTDQARTVVFSPEAAAPGLSFDDSATWEEIREYADEMLGAAHDALCGLSKNLACAEGEGNGERMLMLTVAVTDLAAKAIHLGQLANVHAWDRMSGGLSQETRRSVPSQ